MRTTKHDATFYCFERVALAKVLHLAATDTYIGESGALDLMQRISKSFGMQCPAIKKTRKDSAYCYYKFYEHAIYFNYSWGLTALTTIHEMAHAVHHHLRTGGEVHGAEFTRVWIDLVSRMYEIDPLEFEKIAAERGLPFTLRTVRKPQTQYVPKYG